MEALLYGYMTWAPRNSHYRKLRTTHHKLHLRVTGYRRVHGTYRQMSYAKALKKTGSQSVEATNRHRRLLFAGALTRQGDKRLPKRLLFVGRLEEGEDPGPGQPANQKTNKRGKVEEALLIVVIVSEQPVLCFCVVFLLFTFPIFYFVALIYLNLGLLCS